MPTLDQLAPATAASDSDKLLVSQHGIARSVTRSQILAGVQPQLAIGTASLLGRSSTGVGAPESISIGSNLTLANGVLAASAAPFNIVSLAPGTVPTTGDLVPLCQNSSNIAVTYSQFMSGLAGVANVDVSQLLVTPAGTKSPIKLGDHAASTLLLTGGVLTGSLTLAADPSAALQAATKRYVDAQVATSIPRSGGTLSGSLTLATDPTASLQAATKQYVDGQVATAVPRSGGALTGPLTLPADPSIALHAATKQYVDGQLSTAITKAGGTLSGALMLAADPASPLQAATKQYVDARLSRTGDTLTGALMLAGDPTVTLQAATKGYVDNLVAGSLPKAGGTLTGTLTLSADPTGSLQAATKRYVDNMSGSGGSGAWLPLIGGNLSGPLVLAGNPTSAMQAAPKQYVDSQITTAVPLAGGTMTGALTLTGDPSGSLHAATKRYVDASAGGPGVINVKAAPYSATLDGVTDDTAAFKAAYQAAPAGSVIYVPNGIAVLKAPNTWGMAVTKRVKWIVDGTTTPDGTALSNTIPGGGGPANNYLPGIVVGNSAQSAEISQNGSQPTDIAVLHSSYIVNHAGGPTGGSVIANARHDTIIYNSPANYVWGSIDRLLWCGTQTPAGTTAEHVGRYVQTIRQSAGVDGTGKTLPQPNLWAACLEYRDSTGLSSNSTAAGITVEMDWFGNGPDDGSKRTIQSLVIGQHNLTGTPVEISAAIGVWLASGHSGRIYRVFNINVPFSMSVLDTTAAVQLSGAAAIRMAAGHSIAFEPSNNYRLAYDSATSTLRWYQGGLSFPVGKGISVGWQTVYFASATVPNYIAGNLIFLGGVAPYTITLPLSNTVAAGTGYTFSCAGFATVTIAVQGSDWIENGPIVLFPNDRFHVVSDGSSAWREIFRTNAVSPRFTGPPVLPSYVVGSLPSGVAGAKAFATNGRKPGEPTGGGTGVEVYHDGRAWVSVSSGSAVAA